MALFCQDSLTPVDSLLGWSTLGMALMWPLYHPFSQNWPGEHVVPLFCPVLLLSSPINLSSWATMVSYSHVPWSPWEHNEFDPKTYVCTVWWWKHVASDEPRGTRPAPVLADNPSLQEYFSWGLPNELQGHVICIFFHMESRGNAFSTMNSMQIFLFPGIVSLLFYSVLGVVTGLGRIVLSKSCWDIANDCRM